MILIIFIFKFKILSRAVVNDVSHVMRHARIRAALSGAKLIGAIKAIPCRVHLQEKFHRKILQEIFLRKLLKMKYLSQILTIAAAQSGDGAASCDGISFRSG